MDTAMQTVLDAVTEMNRVLTEEHGWTRVNPYEIATPDRKLWFGTGYVTGEYTVHASHRELGYGAARGNIRVRITPTLLHNHPELGRLLAQDLVDAQVTVNELGFSRLVWPPPHWSELSVQGVVDHR